MDLRTSLIALTIAVSTGHWAKAHPLEVLARDLCYDPAPAIGATGPTGVLYWLGWNFYRVRSRQNALEEIGALGGGAAFASELSPADLPKPRVPVWRVGLGDKAVAQIILPVEYTDEARLTRRVVAQFPEATYTHVWWTEAKPSILAKDRICVWVMNADGSQARRLVRLDEHCFMPRWSHDGKSIAMEVGYERDHRQVFVANADGSDPRRVSKGREPDWSPDDKQLLVTVNDKSVESTEVVSVDSTRSERISQGHGSRWSPRGERLLTQVMTRKQVHMPDGSTWFPEVAVAKLTDLADNTETELIDLAEMLNVSWSPDGKSLAFFGREAKNERRTLHIVNIESVPPSSRSRLEAKQSASVANYSPDGKQLVFDVDGLIHVVDVEGNAPPRVLPGQKGRSMHPHYSPDGKKIVFVSSRPE